MSETLSRFYAHTAKGLPEEEWELLWDHLLLTAEGDIELPGTAGFAAAFGASGLGRLVGLWHDLGKYSHEFQAYLHSAESADAGMSRGSVDHSTAGAQLAASQFRSGIGMVIAYCIAGHHGGLSDFIDDEGGQAGLIDRLRKEVPSVIGAPQDLLHEPCPRLPHLVCLPGATDRAFQAGVLCRMLFSCLVDADYLATERFMRPGEAAGRAGLGRGLKDLLLAVDRYVDDLVARSDLTTVNQHRQTVLRACRAAANHPPGLFTLTVPTGGGKTLSSLRFALGHAVAHGLRRVIYAIPYTSIVEQTADVFRRALGPASKGVVLEHHSNLDPFRDSYCARLAAENWDAPIVVTTNVQLFESLFANRPGRCRKLHRIAGSVIVLDEAQALPVNLLTPTLAMINELARDYGCSIVLCTATQPAVLQRDEFPIGLAAVHEIIPDPPSLHQSLVRTRVESVGQVSDDELAAAIGDYAQCLCVVNNRRHAAALFQRLVDAGTLGALHLSAQMCPRHRSAVLRAVRRRLHRGAPCRVISTSVIEAGVDVDFPIVFRAMAGLDSIAQAAGRCNREGRRDQGIVRVFDPDSEDATPPPFVRQAAQDTREIVRDGTDVLSPETIEAYFRLHYWKRKDLWDREDIMSLFGWDGPRLRAQFKQAAQRYRFIDDVQFAVTVPYGGRGRRLVKQLRSLPEPPGRCIVRQMQRITVTVFENEFRRLIACGGVEQLFPKQTDTINVLVNPRLYDRHLGLRPGLEHESPSDLIV